MIDHRKQLILYVDDTVEQRYAMRRILETAGYAVAEAGDGAAAMEKLDASIALAVVDVRLPDISGYDLSKKMKAQFPNLPILQVSASFSDPQLRASGLSGGADAYIAQPVHPAELTSLIRRMLRTLEAEESLRFLASLGPSLSSSLSIEMTANNFLQAIVPAFADQCALSLETSVDDSPALFANDEERRHALQTLMERGTVVEAASFLEDGSILAPLRGAGERIGVVSFKLAPDREYTTSDLAMASDLANRAALALQNCQLFASERATRAALIQSEKLATAGRMSAAIAHEINNPLEALTNLIYILEQAPDMPESLREIAATALAEVMRLAHITRQSLGFYRELRAPEKLNLVESVRDTISLYAKRLTSARIELIIHAPDEVAVDAVRGEIRQVISNLLANAIEVSPEGGSISITLEEIGQRARLTVADTGPGVDPGVSAKIFEPFITTKQGTGTGLGLWITKSIVEKHGGTISFRSQTEEQQGAVFYVDLPSSTL